MELIDEDGRIFGVVNVIDALAVLLVLAVVVAGIALVNPFASTEEATRYATVDLGEQPAYVADQVSPGDVMSPTNTPRNLTITDVYVTPAGEGNVSVVVRARINGTLEDREGAPGTAFRFAGDRLRQGGSLSIDTADYTAGGTVLRLDAAGRTLETDRRQVRVSTAVSPGVARTIETGDAVTLAGRNVANVTDVHRSPGPDSTTRRIDLGVELEALQRSDGPSYGGALLSLDRQLAIDTGTYRVTGRIESLETDRIRTASTAVTARTTVGEAVSTRLSVGDTYRVANRSIAEITAIQRFPGGEAGQHQLFMGLRLETVVEDGERFFGPNRLALGQSIPFRTDVTAMSAAIQSVGSDDIRRETTSTVIETTVPGRVADDVSVGDEYQVAGSTVATVKSVETYPAGDGDRRRLLLGLDVTTVRREGGQFFGTAPLRLGSTIPFETDAYRLSGTVINRASFAPPGEQTTKTVVVKVANVEPEIADGIREGMTEGTGENASARIVDKRVEPASVILTSESGEIFQRQHPRNEDVYLTVEVTVRETRTGLRFHSQPLQEGTGVTLDFRTISVQGTVIDIE